MRHRLQRDTSTTSELQISHYYIFGIKEGGGHSRCRARGQNGASVRSDTHIIRRWELGVRGEHVEGAHTGGCSGEVHEELAVGRYAGIDAIAARDHDQLLLVRKRGGVYEHARFPVFDVA